jgi:hypothetical protein
MIAAPRWDVEKEGIIRGPYGCADAGVKVGTNE